MLKNYLTTALRNMMRHKLYTLINIGGLAIGLAACILIFLFVKDELSYDGWWPQSDQLYKLEAAYNQGENGYSYSALSPGRLRDPLAKNFENDFEAISRLNRDGHIFNRDGDIFEELIWFADADIFKIFDIDMINGSREDIFRDNSALIISQSMATKYFGNSDPLGMTLAPDDSDKVYKVVGVMKDLPENTHLSFEFLTMFNPLEFVDRPWISEFWLSSNVHTYIKLNKSVSAETIEAAIPSFLNRNVIRSEQPGLVGDPGDMVHMRLLPVSDIHLYSTGRFQMKPNGDINVVYSFTVIALLILFIASINFINLSTARASMRSREIALRKVVGASRGQLITQFLGEAGLMVFLALIVALSIVEFALPWFGDFVAKFLSLEYGSDPMTMLMLCGLLIVVGIGAGMLPAIQITRFRPATVLRSNNSSANTGSKLRVILVTIQFAISIGLITATMIVYSQTQYTTNKDLGFESSDRLLLENMNYDSIAPVASAIRQEIDRLPGVLNSAYTARDIPLRGFWDFPVRTSDASETDDFRLEMVPGDSNFLEFFGARTIAGRMFSKEFLADSAIIVSADGQTITKNIVINRAAVSHLNFDTPEQALGQTVKFVNFDGIGETATIIGVVEDMHMRTLRDTVQPVSFTVEEDNKAVLNVHIKSDDQQATLSQINRIWKQHVPAFPIDLSYMDERFGVLYEADVQRGQMFGYFSIFAVIVSCLGLFGLSAFTAEQKTKEIGVRKVFGAKNSSIIQLLVWQFSKPVLVANLIAWPVAWYVMSDWLSGFAYRIEMSVIPFLISGSIALTISWLTVSLHAWRVAKTNPIHALRCE